MFSSLKIQHKLVLLCSAFAVPIIFLAYLFIAQTEKDITFAAKELEGCAYVSALQSELRNLVSLAQGADTSAELTKDLSNVVHLDAAKAESMNAKDSAAKAAGTVRGALSLPKGIPAGSYDVAIQAVLDHITAIQDGSNLTLDPDLDSYYIQDLVTVKLPAAVVAANRLLTATLPLAATDKPNATMMALFLTRKGEFAAALAGIDRNVAAAERGNPSGSVKQTVAAAYAEFGVRSGAFTSVLDSLATPNGVRPSMAEVDAAQTALQQASGGLFEDGLTILSSLLQERIGHFKDRMIWSLVLTALVLLATVVFAWWQARAINQPVGALVGMMGRMAAGDLSSPVPDWKRQDEIGVLARSAEEMRRHLQVLVTEVRTHASSVHEATQSIARSVEAEAATSSEMSASVAEITSTMEEFSTSSSQIAEHAGAVAEIANRTWENAKNGMEAMQLLSARMNGIQDDNEVSLKEIIDLGDKSKEISQVMKIINAIADQTKLIAFNAALEASSAGEAGRRFGVVAAEIRRLADSVTESTGEIEGKIEQIQDAIQRLVINSEKGANNISSGMTAATGTAEQMNHLVDAAQRTANAAQQISLSTQQQKSASAQVVVALREIVGASAHTAQSIANISETSRTMTGLSVELGDRVGRFRLETETPAG